MPKTTIWAADPPLPALGMRVPFVLVVDDEMCIRTLLSACLERDGYKVLAATNGDEALAAFRLLPSGLDLVITDVEMPGMSGIELANTISQESPGIPILFISGRVEAAEILEKTSVQGPLSFIRKPFDLLTLRQTVSAAIGKKLG